MFLNKFSILITKSLSMIWLQNNCTNVQISLFKLSSKHSFSSSFCHFEALWGELHGSSSSQGDLIVLFIQHWGSAWPYYFLCNYIIHYFAIRMRLSAHVTLCPGQAVWVVVATCPSGLNLLSGKYPQRFFLSTWIKTLNF